MTTYVVLLEYVVNDGADSDLPSYSVVTRLDAHSAQAACRVAADELAAPMLEKGVTLIAVPARNWQHINLRAETSRRVVRS